MFASGLLQLLYGRSVIGRVWEAVRNWNHLLSLQCVSVADRSHWAALGFTLLMIIVVLGRWALWSVEWSVAEELLAPVNSAGPCVDAAPPQVTEGEVFIWSPDGVAGFEPNDEKHRNYTIVSDSNGFA